MLLRKDAQFENGFIMETVEKVVVNNHKLRVLHAEEKITKLAI